jgi:hypothetical protein
MSTVKNQVIQKTQQIEQAKTQEDKKELQKQRNDLVRVSLTPLLDELPGIRSESIDYSRAGSNYKGNGFVKDLESYLTGDGIITDADANYVDDLFEQRLTKLSSSADLQVLHDEAVFVTDHLTQDDTLTLDAGRDLLLKDDANDILTKVVAKISDKLEDAKVAEATVKELILPGEGLEIAGYNGLMGAFVRSNAEWDVSKPLPDKGDLFTHDQIDQLIAALEAVPKTTYEEAKAVLDVVAALAKKQQAMKWPAAHKDALDQPLTAYYQDLRGDLITKAESQLLDKILETPASVAQDWPSKPHPLKSPSEQVIYVSPDSPFAYWKDGDTIYKTDALSDGAVDPLAEDLTNKYPEWSQLMEARKLPETVTADAKGFNISKPTDSDAFEADLNAVGAAIPSHG